MEYHFEKALSLYLKTNNLDLEIVLLANRSIVVLQGVNVEQT